MTPELAERLDVLRRIAERGLHHAAEQWVVSGFLSRDWNREIDRWQHLLNELNRVYGVTHETGRF
jgi:hypothetical protein